MEERPERPEPTTNSGDFYLATSGDHELADDSGPATASTTPSAHISKTGKMLTSETPSPAGGAPGVQQQT